MLAQQDSEFERLWAEACQAPGRRPRRKMRGSAYLASMARRIRLSSPAHCRSDAGQHATRRSGQRRTNSISDQGVLEIGDAEFQHGVCTPVMSVHEAGAIAARNVLNRGLQTRAIGMKAVPDGIREHALQAAI